MTGELLVFLCIEAKEVIGMSMEKFANHVIAVAKKNSRPITNLQLQKIMYFTLKIALDEGVLSFDEAKKIYDEPFQVWQYGPVVRSQYERFRGFASEPIIGSFQLDNSLNRLNNIIDELLDVNVFSLVKISHMVPFWIQNEDKIIGFRSNEEYSLEDI